MTAPVGSTPLAEIEQRVQRRARDADLDLAAEGSAGALAALIDEEIRSWNDDQRRGRHPHPLADPGIVAERALRNLTGYGPLGPLLADDDVWEIMVNAPDAVFVKRHQGHSGYHDEVFHDDDHVRRTLTKILDDATGAHRTLDPTTGLQDAQLTGGARLHIVHDDIARDGHIMINIRKFTGVPIRTLAELVERDALSAPAADFLRACVSARQTIVVAGAPGTGKTTLLSCCAAELDPSLRLVVAEEVFEADVALPNIASMQTRAARRDRPAVDLRDLVSGFLRMAPDIAIVGEVRDREALPLLLTLTSGVKGLTTIHAGSTRQALTRLRFICQLSERGSHLPMSALNTLVTEAIDVVVHCERTADGPRVGAITAVEDLTGPIDTPNFTTTDVFARSTPQAPLVWTGAHPSRLRHGFDTAGLDLRRLLDQGTSP